MSDWSTLGRPAFLMNTPFGYNAKQANNVWMTELSDEDREIDTRRALAQWMDLYNTLALESLVYVLPTPEMPLQDLVFTANLGIVLTHLPTDIVVLANMATEPRKGEEIPGRRFFEQFRGVEVFDCPFTFEGEAELKHLHDNVYIGGYGDRSSIETYHWMESEFDMRIIKVEETSPYLYHLDCSVFPVTRGATMVAVECFTESEVNEIREVTDVIEIAREDAEQGICNSVRLGSLIVNASDLNDYDEGSDEFFAELDKNKELEDIACEYGLEVAYVNLGEYAKGGALLSCMTMHLNRQSYGIESI